MKKLLTLFCSLSFLSGLALGEQLKPLPSQSCIIPDVTYTAAANKNPDCIPSGANPKNLNGKNLQSYLDTKCPSPNLMGVKQESHKVVNVGASTVLYSHLCLITCRQPSLTCYYSSSNSAK